MPDHFIRRSITALGVMTSRPWAFATVAAYSIAWWVFEPRSIDWHAIATIATWMMTLFIQRAAHRDTQALQAKLDELIRKQKGARNELIGLDDAEPEEIEKHRAAERATGS